ncbi:TPA: phosphatase, partial [bacterium]|nr:phosphatase [bacterium]
MPVDLHIHTSFSDSTLTPREVVSYAHQMGLSAIGITDHDTVDGIEPTMEIAKEYDLEI